LRVIHDYIGIASEQACLCEEDGVALSKPGVGSKYICI